MFHVLNRTPGQAGPPPPFCLGEGEEGDGVSRLPCHPGRPVIWKKETEKERKREKERQRKREKEKKGEREKEGKRERESERK